MTRVLLYFGGLLPWCFAIGVIVDNVDAPRWADFTFSAGAGVAYYFAFRRLLRKEVR